MDSWDSHKEFLLDITKKHFKLKIGRDSGCF